MNVYLFRGQKEKGKSIDTILMRYKLSTCNPKNRAMVTKIKTLKDKE